MRNRSRARLRPIAVAMTCKIRDCGADQYLHRHHVDEYAKHRRTTYEILGRLCAPHHDFVTHRGYTVIDHGDGTWSLRAPPRGRRGLNYRYSGGREVAAGVDQASMARPSPVRLCPCSLTSRCGG